MRSSEAEDPGPSGWGLDELRLLAALGFGPDSALMNEPKLFVDGTFLAAFQHELVSEFGEEEAARTLFHIGTLHGLRDAARIGDTEPGRKGRPRMIETPPLAMRFGPSRGATRAEGAEAGAEAAGIELGGCWPDHYEAEARLNRLGVTDHPSCSLSAGYTAGWLSGTLERDIVVEELRCRAAGHEDCCFLARDEGAARTEAGAKGRLPVSALRAVALAPTTGPSLVPASAPASPSPSPSIPTIATRVDALPPDMDPDDPAVHIWGPVMVVPFSHPEAAMQTVEMLARDEATRVVRVVVLDLGGAILDASFGAAALEYAVNEMLSWGAEVILTGISPLSEEIVAELQASLMITRKDLSEAIAYAFQIADAQRHLL